MCQHRTLLIYKQGIPRLPDLDLINHIDQVAYINCATYYPDDFISSPRKYRAGGHRNQLARRFGPEHIAEITVPLHRLLEIIPIRGINPVILALNSICVNNTVPSEQNDGFISISSGFTNPDEFSLHKGDFTPALFSANLRNLLRGSLYTVGKGNRLGKTQFLRQPQIDRTGQTVRNICHFFIGNG
ncbi:MAG: hypothetical protein A4E74_00689 [Syntrophus sp. PtaB.Bin075]|nr:MAG: hypothetical protein A4E74_00689 [Syntrophus sp. PtaB.Bin075]